MNPLDPVTKASINQFLTEKFLGKCWHESEVYDVNILYYGTYQFLRCQKCKVDCRDLEPNLDLFSPEGFFLLWEKAQEEGYIDEIVCYYDSEKNTNFLDPHYINYLTFPKLLAEYLGWKEGEKG